jgi:kynurenine formamidase
MCHRCVTESVTRRMLSRRDFMAAAPAAAAAAATAAAAPPALAQGARRVEDLTHTHSPAFPTFGGDPGISMEQKFKLDPDGYNLFEITLDEHTGTHMDAPLHFSADGASVDQVPVAQLVVPLAVVDIRGRAAEEADTQVTPDDLESWQSAHGDLPQGGAVAMLSGWAGHVGSDRFRNADSEGVMHFPGFHPEATQMLLEETDLIGMVVDTLSLDHGASKDFATHYAWLPAGRWGLECVANLDRLPASGATLVVGAPKFKGGTGGQSRVLALV